MLNRYNQIVPKWHHMEPLQLDKRGEYVLLGSAVSDFFILSHLILCVTMYITRVGVGFSYADYGETVGTTEEAAQNIHAFITIFFGTFKQFSGRPLHLAGESYAVREFNISLLNSDIYLSIYTLSSIPS